jgi:hypothetical protein
MDATRPCWICGAPADSAEHMVKASDFNAIFPSTTHKTPAFRHSKEQTNQTIKGVNSPILKFKPSICQQCNNARTQQHDKAWARLSHAVRNPTLPLRAGSRLPLKVIFPDGAREAMTCVHLYFTKLLGCYAIEYGIPLPVFEFGTCISNGNPHPHIRLIFVHVPVGSTRDLIQARHVDAANFQGRTVSALWHYLVGSFGVMVSYCEPGHRPHRFTVRQGWHPTDRSPAVVLR